MKGEWTLTFPTWEGLDVRVRFLAIDAVLGFFLFTPLVVLHNYGTSAILETLVLTRVHPALGGLFLLGVGIGVEFSAAFWQRYIRAQIQREPQLYYQVATRLYNYVLSFANICHFKGVEALFGLFRDPGAEGTAMFAAQTLFTTTALLWGLKAGRNIITPPLTIALDCKDAEEDFFEASSYYGTEPNLSKDSLVDTLMTTGLISSLIYLQWISLWFLLEDIVFPENVALSMTVSWISGCVITASYLFLQHRAKKLSTTLETEGRRDLKVIFEDVFILGAHLGCVLTWKGIWMFFDVLCVYFPIFRNSRDVTHLYAHMAGFGLLTACYLSSSTVNKGCEIDGSKTNGEGVTFSLDYFGVFFKEQIQRELKRQKEWNKEESEIEEEEEEREEVCEEEEGKEEEEELGEEEEEEEDIRRALEDNATLNKVRLRAPRVQSNGSNVTRLTNGVDDSKAKRHAVLYS